MLFPVEHQPREPFGRREIARLLLLLGVAGFLCFARINGALLEPEEARYAEIPREMLGQDRWLIPVFEGQAYLDKPPLLYWAVMACYSVFGVSVWSARLVPCLAAWLTVVVVYLWVRRSCGRGAATVAAAVLILSGDFVYRGSMLTMNGLLGLFVVSALAAGHLAVAERRRAWWLASALACAAGVMTKGPVAVALVGVPLAWLLWSVEGVRWRGVGALAGYAAVVALMSGPWFVAVAIREPEFANYFFWKHHVERVVTPFDHAKPGWYYLPQVALGFFPWSLVLVPMAVAAVRGSDRPRYGSTEWLGLIAAGWTLLLFSLSGSKRPVYLVPLWPLLAVAVGVRLHAVLSSDGAKLLGLTARGWYRVGGVTLAVLLATVAVWLPAYARGFSIPREAVVEVVHASADDREVYCYPHRWESVAFYAQREDVKAFHRGELPHLLDTLRDHPEVAVVLQSGPEGEAFIRALPPGVEFERHGKTALVTVGILRRK